MNLLGRYQILDQIGTGSMGTVYRARDTVLDREVAIKTIRTSGEVDPEIRERFYREARACARLQHPNIVAVYDLAEADKIAYIAMELLHGSDLRRVIEQKSNIPMAAKLAAMVQICEALDHAHRHGVIHRDIKPSNLFLQEDGRAKVMDFGIARLPSSRLTVAGNILGTPNYMAPEQILGKTTDARADLFSAALVYFEFLTLVHPFHATVIPHRIVEGEPDSLFDHDANLPPLLEKVLDRALAKEPDQRYQTGMDFANDLRAVMDAVRLNASPTMSKLELPSERALPKQQPVVEGDMTLLKPAPLGEDPAEWRLSEVLRLIPAFEEAVEAKNRTGAQKALGELKAIGAADKRFTEPAESCQGSYDKTFGQSTGKGTGSQQAAPPPLPVAPAAPPAVIVQPVPPPAAKPATPVPAAVQLKPATTLSGPKLSKDHTRMIVAAAVVLAAITAIVWVISLFSRPVPLETSEGMAKVRAASATVRKSPDTNAAVVAQVGAGETLRLLDLPRDRNAAWLRVQPVVNGKNYAPGYVQIADLEDWSDWSVEKPVAMAAVVRAMGPDNNASEDALKAQVVKVKKLADKLVDDQASEQMRQEVTRLEGILAARQQESQQPEVQSAGDTGQPAPPAASAPAVPAATGAAPPAVPAAPVVAETPEATLARAKRRLDRRDLAGAKALVRQVLRKEPNNKAASELMLDIEEVEKLVQ